MNELIIPGIYVIHPKEKDWGIGQVQSKIGNAGKKTINGKEIKLNIVKNEI